MSGLVGKLLVASPLLTDPNFYRTVVLILQHDDTGAVGVVLNRPTSSPIRAHLPEWEDAVIEPAVVFVGGPVEQAIAIGLAVSGTEPAGVDGVWLVDLEAPPPGPETARVYSGYAGWGAGQLVSELEEGSWIVLDAESRDVFEPEPSDLWSLVLRRQGGKLALLATFPADPSLN